MTPLPNYVFKHQAKYAHDEQLREPAIQQLMAAEGHPFASEYRRLRQAFDSLPYASSAGFRIYACASKFELAECSAPALLVDGNKAPDESLVLDLAASHWPAGYDYDLDAGDWYVRTADEAFIARLRQCLSAGTRRVVKGFSLDTSSPGEWEAIQALIDVHFRNARLHPAAYVAVRAAARAAAINDPQRLRQLSADLSAVRQRDTWL